MLNFAFKKMLSGQYTEEAFLQISSEILTPTSARVVSPANLPTVHQAKRSVKVNKTDLVIIGGGQRTIGIRVRRDSLLCRALFRTTLSLVCSAQLIKHLNFVDILRMLQLICLYNVKISSNV